MKAYKQFWFEASHTLPDNPQLHGHSYLATIWVKTDAAKPVILKEIDKLEWQLKKFVDHRHLNDFIDNPTMEKLAQTMYEYGSKLITTQKIDIEFLCVDVARPSLNFGVTT